MNPFFEFLASAALCLSIFTFIKVRRISKAKEQPPLVTEETPKAEVATDAPVTSGHIRIVPNSYFMRGRR